MKKTIKQFLEEASNSTVVTPTLLGKICDAPGALDPEYINSARSEAGWHIIRQVEHWRIQVHEPTNAVRILDEEGRLRACGHRKQILRPITNVVRRWKEIGDFYPSADDIGIVLCGGGAKGAFQIGVWKYLRETGIDARITGVSGASIGALNSLFLAQGDLDKAERAWMAMTAERLWCINEKLLRVLALEMTPPIAPIAMFSPILNDKLAENLGLLSRNGLEQLMTEYLSPDAVCQTEKLVFSSLAALRLSPSKLGKKKFIAKSEYHCWKHLSYEAIKLRVFASAAYPGAYSPVKIKNTLYLDGGYLDNDPVRPLVEAGYRNIVVVSLSSHYADDLAKWYHKKLKQDEDLNDLLHSKVRFFHVGPAGSLGNLLEISPDKTEKRIVAGYEAAKAHLAELVC